MRFTAVASLLALALAGCGGDGSSGGGGPIAATPTPTPTATATPAPTPSPTVTPTPMPIVTLVTRTPVASFDNPWAMVFLPDGRLLVTEKPGKLWLVTTAGAKTQVTGVPAVYYGGQLGFQDVILAPDFATTGRVYLSYAEPGSGGQALAVARATLVQGSAPRLDNLTVIWRAIPTTTGGQLGARLAFSPDGHLFVATGDRQQPPLAQAFSSSLGKIVRLNADGGIPPDNPFHRNVPIDATSEAIWTLGHRNPYGLVFASDGRLFESEMGPAGGDEFNLVTAGKNYGWPNVSEGDNYDGTKIPRHSTNGSYVAPLVSWTPVIAPGGMIQYRGARFTGWTGDFILAGLVSQGLVRVRVTGSTAAEIARTSLGARIREVEEGPDGAIWVLEDGTGGRLIRLDPA